MRQEEAFCFFSGPAYAPCLLSFILSFTRSTPPFVFWFSLQTLNTVVQLEVSAFFILPLVFHCTGSLPIIQAETAFDRRLSYGLLFFFFFLTSKTLTL